MNGGFHLFALVPAAALPPDPWPRGLENGEVVLLPVGSVAAVAQQVSDTFLDRLHDGSSDPASQGWLTDRLLDHARVAEAFADGPGLPLGFGVIFADPAVLPAALGSHLATLSDFFGRAAGRREWCLKFFLRDEVPRRAEMAKVARSGLDYLAARRAVPERLAAREAAGRAFVEHALKTIEPLSEAVLSHDSGATPAKGLRLLANLALLVREERSAEVLDAVDALVSPANTVGLELTLTGPWPLYSFRPRIALGPRADSVSDP